MKGVTYMRVKFQPRLECDDCDYSLDGSPFLPPTVVRSGAQWHVRNTGHTARVRVEDVTVYGPNEADGDL